MRGITQTTHGIAAEMSEDVEEEGGVLLAKPGEIRVQYPGQRAMKITVEYADLPEDTSSYASFTVPAEVDGREIEEEEYHAISQRQSQEILRVFNIREYQENGWPRWEWPQD